MLEGSTAGVLAMWWTHHIASLTSGSYMWNTWGLQHPIKKKVSKNPHHLAFTFHRPSDLQPQYGSDQTICMLLGAPTLSNGTNTCTYRHVPHTARCQTSMETHRNCPHRQKSLKN